MKERAEELVIYEGGSRTQSAAALSCYILKF